MQITIIDKTVAQNGHGLHTPARICLHTTESGDSPGGQDILNVMNFWHNQSKGLGSQLLVSKGGIVGRYVFDKHIAWAAWGANTGTLHIEIIGRASFTKLQWFMRLKQLWTVADIIAYWSKKWDIPVRKDLHHGVLTHKMASDAFGGDHWDPGPAFPLGFVLRSATKRL